LPVKQSNSIRQTDRLSFLNIVTEFNKSKLNKKTTLAQRAAEMIATERGILQSA
jgi:hypothetical protein